MESLHTTSDGSRSACITSLAIEYNVWPEYDANVAKSDGVCMFH